MGVLQKMHEGLGGSHEGRTWDPDEGIPRRNGACWVVTHTENEAGGRETMATGDEAQPGTEEEGDAEEGDDDFDPLAVMGGMAEEKEAEESEWMKASKAKREAAEAAGRGEVDLDSFSTAWMCSWPTSELQCSNPEFLEVSSLYFGLPSPACAGSC